MASNDVSARIQSLAQQRILIIDGAMGTALQGYGLTERDYRGERLAGHPRDLKGNNDILVLTRPDVVRQIHRDYLDADADILETNTFGATRVAQADYGTEDLAFEINYAAARIARELADEYSDRNPDKRRFVAGAIGPMNRSLSISPDVNDPGARSVTFDQVRDAYAEQVRGLIEGGVDILLAETVFDTLNLKACLLAIEEIFAEKGVRLPLMISVTIVDKSGRTLSGQTVEAFWDSVRHARPLSIGVNCSLGAQEMRPYVAELAQIAPTLVSAYPNAGLPNAFGGYDQAPEETAELLEEYCKSGIANIVGGCCGTTPAHIRAIAERARYVEPRRPPEVEPLTRLSGLEPLTIRPDSNFIMVGERTNVTGSKRFARLI